MTPAQQKWLDEYMGETSGFKRGGAAEYETGNQLDLENLDPSQLESLDASRMEGVSTDPRYKDAQLEALRSMEVRSKQGMTAQDEADMFRLQQQVNTANRGRLGAIQNQMASRGMSGSGMDAAMQLQASQDAGEREALASMEKAGQIQSNKMNAAKSLGQMGGEMRGQEFGEQSAKAQAADTINRFNVANRVDRQNQNVDVRNRGRTANWDRQNQTADRNAGAGYQYRRDAMQAGQGAAEVGMNAATQDENARLLREQEKRRRKTQALSTGLGIAGGVVGGIYGGPAGAGAGYSVGSGVGTAVGNANYSHGTNSVPYPDGMDESDMHPGDDTRNDVVPAMLSPGEKVVSREQAAYDDYLNRLKSSVAEKQANVDSAQSNKKIADYGAIFTGALNDYNKGSRRDTILAANPFKDGSVPAVSRGEVNEIKDYASPMADENLARADKELAQGKADFGNEDKFKRQFTQDQRAEEKYNRDMSIQKDEDDSGSEVSATYQTLAKKMLPSKDFSGYSASQLKQSMPSLEKLYQIDQNAENKRSSAAQRREDRADALLLRDNENQIKLETEAKKKAEGAAKEDVELMVPGYGKARTLSEAKEFREAVASNDSSVEDLKAVKELGRNINIADPRDRERVNLIQQKLSQAVGKLRISLTGPGAMTEAERKLIRESIGDPTTLFSTEGIQFAKLDQLMKSIDDSTKRTAKMIIVSPETQTTRVNEALSKLPGSGSKGTAHWTESE